MKKLAISYLRFSSAKQRKGASYARQIQATEDYCKTHGLTLIDQLEDKETSGWTGANLDDEAALGQFLKLVEAGKVEAGTTLIVENLDRITRTQLTRAVHIITGILLHGIDILTTMDGRRYTRDSDTTDIIIAVTILMRGNEESNTKSKRVLDAWDRKRAAINRGEFVKMTQHPNWLEVKNGKYEPNREAEKTVQSIFEMYASGMGSHVIAKELNRRGVKPFARAKKASFTFSSIERLLKTEAVIGTCDVVDPPKKGYWPRVISDELWYKVQALRQQNNHFKGSRNDAQQINFLGGLAKCAKCGAKMVRYSCKGKNEQRYHYLTCSAAKYGEHSLDLAPYEAIQETFILGMLYNNLLDQFLKVESDKTIKDGTPALKGKLVELQKVINRVSDAILKTDSPALTERLIVLEEEQKDLRAQLEAETIRVTGISAVNTAYSELVNKLPSKIQDNSFRRGLRDFLRQIIDKVVIGRDERKRCVYSVHPKNCNQPLTIEISNPHKADRSYVIRNGKTEVRAE